MKHIWRIASQSNQYYHYISQVAAITVNFGISTSCVKTYAFLEPIDAWGFPKYPSKTVITPVHTQKPLEHVIKLFIKNNRIFLEEEGTYFGTWIHPDTRQCYLDITMSHPDFEEARNIANRISLREGRRIIALYNSLHRETIYL